MDANDTNPRAGTDGAPAPQKYVRTFERDMAELEAGRTPDLTPVPSEAPAEPPVPTPAPATFVPPKPPEEPPLPNPDATPEERLVAPSALPPMDAVDIPQAPPPAPLAPMPPPPVGPTPIHTYAEDFNDQLKDTNASQMDVLAAEQDAGPVPTAVPPPAPRTGSILYAFGGILLVALGGGGLYYAYQHYVRAGAPVAITTAVSTPIFVNDEEQIAGTSTALAQAIAQSASRPLSPGSVRLLYTADATSTGMSVFSALQLGAPDILLRNIHASGSMAGIVEANGSQYPFFILAVDSYGDTFAGMLAWKAQMPRQLALFYPSYVPPPVVSSTTATSTSTKAASSTATVLPAPTQAPGFTDQVIANHDARVYRDAYGHVDIVYGYWNPSTLIIAHDAGAFTELVNRFATSRAP